MTNVTVNDVSAERNIIEPNAIEEGNWYKVVSYPHNSHFNGTVGIGYYFAEDDCKGIICTDGCVLNNTDFRFVELSQVNIQVQE